jgi:hypothetical protein
MPSQWEEQFKSQIIKCECGSIIHPNNKYSHCKTKYHIETIKLKNNINNISVINMK